MYPRASSASVLNQWVEWSHKSNLLCLDFRSQRILLSMLRMHWRLGQHTHKAEVSIMRPGVAVQYTEGEH
jgi:hypothetical protein